MLPHLSGPGAMLGMLLCGMAAGDQSRDLAKQGWFTFQEVLAGSQGKLELASAVLSTPFRTGRAQADDLPGSFAFLLHLQRPLGA
jgi:hypothetical protein